VKPSYRNAALAASGIAAVAVAAALIRHRTVHDGLIAQTMTVARDHASVLRALIDGAVISEALCCEDDVAVKGSGDGRTIEWSGGRVALVAAPGDRGTELHLSMRGRKYDVKEVVRRIKALLEAGEIPTGARTL
jgi:hypothetical protein